MRVRQHLKLAGIGSGVGLLFGLLYWFGWGCRSCARDSEPAVLIGVFIIAGAVMALMWGKDHLADQR